MIKLWWQGPVSFVVKNVVKMPMPTAKNIMHNLKARTINRTINQNNFSFAIIKCHKYGIITCADKFIFSRVSPWVHRKSVKLTDVFRATTSSEVTRYESTLPRRPSATWRHGGKVIHLSRITNARIQGAGNVSKNTLNDIVAWRQESLFSFWVVVGRVVGQSPTH